MNTRIAIALMIGAIPLLAQNAKVAAEVTPPEPTVKAAAERPLTESEALKIQLSVANIQLLQKEYKIDEYNSKFRPLVEDQQAVVANACKSVGVSAEEITQGKCGLATGVGPDGRPMLAPDGKPVAARVWRVNPDLAPAPSPVVQKEEKK